MIQLYASSPQKRIRQILGDLLLIAWVLLWVRAGLWTYHLIEKLAVPGRYLERSGNGLHDGVDSLPSLIDKLGGPLDALGSNLGKAGSAQVHATHDIAMFFAIVVIITPTVVPVVMRILFRARWALTARTVQRLRHNPQFDHLLAQRALARQPLHRIAAATLDITDTAHQERALAELELRELGLV